jgi:Domain of unknown function (DUF4234)
MMTLSFDQAKVKYVSNVVVDILLTLITFGIYNVYLQRRQMHAVNHMLQVPKYSFLRWAILTIFTFGLYHVYHEYVLSRDIFNVLGLPASNEPLLHTVLSIFGFSIVADALQQNAINRYFGQNTL